MYQHRLLLKTLPEKLRRQILKNIFALNDNPKDFIKSYSMNYSWMLAKAFDWYETEEGMGYWDKIDTRLSQIWFRNTENGNIP